MTAPNISRKRQAVLQRFADEHGWTMPPLYTEADVAEHGFRVVGDARLRWRTLDACYRTEQRRLRDEAERAALVEAWRLHLYEDGPRPE